MEQPASNLFEGYKSLGHVTGPRPFIVRHGKNPADTRIVTLVGRAFHTYTTNLSLVEVSIPHEQEIRSIIADERYIYTTSGRTILQWGHGSKKLIQRLENGHQADITMLAKLSFSKLVSIDEDNVLFHWCLKERSILNIITFDESTFKVSTACHPHQYKDKCLLGSEQGQLQLWNIASEQCLYKFKGWDSKVTNLTQSPMEDVIGVGLDDGHVYILNIKYDEVVMKIYQEYGAVTSMAFRLDNQPYLVTASKAGHLMVWNLEKKRLSTQLRNAHCDEISNCQFIKNQCQLVTSGNDNSLKIWSMDMSDGGGTLLCQRTGHYKPPSHIRFYGSKGMHLLSAGLDSTMKMFHLFSERLNRNLGTARTSKSNKSQHKLPPITFFAAESAKEKQWDNIAACHQGSSLISTWNYDKCRMGDHLIQQPTFNKHDVSASCVSLTSCGNFLVIGFSNGLIFKYNMQSAMFRQYYECPKLTDHRAHDGQVSGISVDNLDLVLVSSGLDRFLRLWHFKNGSLLLEFELSAPIKKLELHRENNLLALALDNNDIEIMDLETRELVRRFSAKSKILDMTFSPDSRWLIVALADKSIRTWDLSLGRQIDSFRLSEVCTSLSVSPTGEFLATAHEGFLGVNVWCNYTIYCPTPLRPIEDDGKEPPLLDMPFVRCDDLLPEDQEAGDDNCIVLEAEENFESAYISPEQLCENLITLSGLPTSRWKNLLHIEEIRLKQRIEEEEKRDRTLKVPFFIPVKDGLKPKLDQEALIEFNRSGKESGVNALRSQIQELRLLSPLAQCLIDCGSKNDYNDFLVQLKQLGPSATDAEIRLLGKESCGGDIQVMLYFLDAIEHNMKHGVDYELTSSWLALFLKVHSDVIHSDAELRERCAKLMDPVRHNWDKLNDEFNRIFCVLNFVRSSIL